MASVVFWKLKNEKSYKHLNFDGHSLTVRELRARISEALGVPPDSDLTISDSMSKKQLENDRETVIRNSKVHVARNVASVQERRQQGPAIGATSQQQQAAAQPVFTPAGPSAEDELGDDPMAKILAAEAEARAVHAVVAAAPVNVVVTAPLTSGGAIVAQADRRGPGRRPLRPEDRCHICHEPGHLSRECPKANDPAYARRTHVRGIPIARLQRDEDGGMQLADGTHVGRLENSAKFAKAQADMARDVTPEMPDHTLLPQLALQAASFATVLPLPEPPVAPAAAAAAAAEACVKPVESQQEVPLMAPSTLLPPPTITPFVPLDPPVSEPAQQSTPSPQHSPLQLDAGADALFGDQDILPANPRLHHSALGLGLVDVKRTPTPPPAADPELLRIPKKLQSRGLDKEHLTMLLPHLQTILPKDMQIGDIIRAYGSGRPLTLTEFHTLQSSYSAPSPAPNAHPVPSSAHASGSQSSRSSGHAPPNSSTSEHGRAKGVSSRGRSREPCSREASKSRDSSGSRARTSDGSAGDRPGVQIRSRDSRERGPLHASKGTQRAPGTGHGKRDASSDSGAANAGARGVSAQQAEDDRWRLSPAREDSTHMGCSPPRLSQDGSRQPSVSPQHGLHDVSEVDVDAAVDARSLGDSLLLLSPSSRDREVLHSHGATAAGGATDRHPSGVRDEEDNGPGRDEDSPDSDDGKKDKKKKDKKRKRKDKGKEKDRKRKDKKSKRRRSDTDHSGADDRRDLSSSPPRERRAQHSPERREGRAPTVVSAAARSGPASHVVQQLQGVKAVPLQRGAKRQASDAAVAAAGPARMLRQSLGGIGALLPSRPGAKERYTGAW